MKHTRRSSYKLTARRTMIDAELLADALGATAHAGLDEKHVWVLRLRRAWSERSCGGLACHVDLCALRDLTSEAGAGAIERTRHALHVARAGDWPPSRVAHIVEGHRGLCHRRSRPRPNRSARGASRRLRREWLLVSGQWRLLRRTRTVHFGGRDPEMVAVNCAETSRYLCHRWKAVLLRWLAAPSLIDNSNRRHISSHFVQLSNFFFATLNLAIEFSLELFLNTV